MAKKMTSGFWSAGVALVVCVAVLASVAASATSGERAPRNAFDVGRGYRCDPEAPEGTALGFLPLDDLLAGESNIPVFDYEVEADRERAIEMTLLHAPYVVRNLPGFDDIIEAGEWDLEGLSKVAGDRKILTYVSRTKVFHWVHQRRQHMTVQEIIDANAREARKCEEQIAAGIPVQPSSDPTILTAGEVCNRDYYYPLIRTAEDGEAGLKFADAFRPVFDASAMCHRPSWLSPDELREPTGEEGGEDDAPVDEHYYAAAADHADDVAESDEVDPDGFLPETDVRCFINWNFEGHGRSTDLLLRPGTTGNTWPAHYDISQNFLAQVWGTKRVFLFAYSEAVKFKFGASTSQMARHSDVNLRNISDYYHETRALEGLATTIYPGDALFIPAFWVHYVESASDNLAINLFTRPLKNPLPPCVTAWETYKDTALELGVDMGPMAASDERKAVKKRNKKNKKRGREGRMRDMLDERRTERHRSKEERMARRMARRKAAGKAAEGRVKAATDAARFRKKNRDRDEL